MKVDITFIGIGGIIGAFAVFMLWQTTRFKAPPLDQKKTHKCKCLTMKEILFHLEKREMFVDKLPNVKRKQRSAIIDSINYHNAILDSTGNRIEY